jgi:hypothetical protein
MVCGGNFNLTIWRTTMTNTFKQFTNALGKMLDEYDDLSGPHREQWSHNGPVNYSSQYSFDGIIMHYMGQIESKRRYLNTLSGQYEIIKKGDLESESFLKNRARIYSSATTAKSEIMFFEELVTYLQQARFVKYGVEFRVATKTTERSEHDLKKDEVDTMEDMFRTNKSSMPTQN